jgi:hypothetical protein
MIAQFKIENPKCKIVKIPPNVLARAESHQIITESVKPFRDQLSSKSELPNGSAASEIS